MKESKRKGGVEVGVEWLLVFEWMAQESPHKYVSWAEM